MNKTKKIIIAVITGFLAVIIPFTEKKRNAYGLSYYQAYWFSWFKGIVFGILLMWIFNR